MSIEDYYYLSKTSGAMKNPRTRFNDELFVKNGEDYLFKYLDSNVGRIDDSRRKFIKGMIFGIGAAAVASALGAIRGLEVPIVGAKSYTKMLLVDSTGSAVKASAFPVNNPIITLYEYPLQNEINFVLNLGDQQNNPVAVPAAEVTVPLDGSKYKFAGGVGPHKSIVSYSAICQHLGCSPPEIHLYPPDEMKTGMPPPALLPPEAITAANSAGIPAVIHCDCHGSTYDPYRGAAVLTGPTERPLPSVVLEWDSTTDQLYAVGDVGVPVYGHTSTLEGGTPVTGSSTVVTAKINPFP